MAFTYGFFNSKNHDRRYDASQMSAIFDGILVDGVLHSVGNVLAVVPGDGMSVVVKSGRAWFNHTWSYNDSPMILSITAADVTLKRYDAVVLEVNSTESVRANSLKVIKGSPASNPSKPALTNTATVHQHVLAYVLVEPGVKTIAANKIDIRVGTSETPFCTGLLQTASIDDLFQAWQADFNTWFNNLKEQLSDNVVTNLQKQIDEKVAKSDRATSSDITNGTSGKWVDASGLKKNNESLVVHTGEFMAIPNGMDVDSTLEDAYTISSEIGSNLIIYCDDRDCAIVYSKFNNKWTALTDYYAWCNPLTKRAFLVKTTGNGIKTFPIYEIKSSSSGNGYSISTFMDVDVSSYATGGYTSSGFNRFRTTRNYIVIDWIGTYKSGVVDRFWFSININTKQIISATHDQFDSTRNFISDIYSDYIYAGSNSTTTPVNIVRYDLRNLSKSSTNVLGNIMQGIAYNGYTAISSYYKTAIANLITGSYINTGQEIVLRRSGLIKNQSTGKYYIYVAPSSTTYNYDQDLTRTRINNGTIVLVDATNGAVSTFHINSSYNENLWVILNADGRINCSDGDTVMGLRGYIYITTSSGIDSSLSRTYLIRFNSSNQPIIEKTITGLPSMSIFTDVSHVYGSYLTTNDPNANYSSYSALTNFVIKPSISSEVR